VAVLREGHVVIPMPETVITPGDEILALASNEAEITLRSAIMGEAEGNGQA
jgi:Trk K+ transport system NAD-binding subunit